jgi:hypothetical protein
MTARDSTVGTPDLGGQRGGDLILDQDVLDRDHQVFSLREPQAQISLVRGSSRRRIKTSRPTPRGETAGGADSRALSSGMAPILAPPRAAATTALDLAHRH